MVLRLSLTLALVSVLPFWVPWVPLVSVGGPVFWVAVLGLVFLLLDLLLDLLLELLRLFNWFCCRYGF